MDFNFLVLVFHIGDCRVGLGDAAVEKIVDVAAGEHAGEIHPSIHDICDF